MPSLKLARYMFHPVGQGLFASGMLYGRWNYIEDGDLSAKPPNFVWVYDCGTVSSQQLLLQEIKHLRQAIPAQKNTIDLLVISHFDQDHISGVVDLLQHFHVRHLLLPFVPLWKRLLLAFQQGLYSSQMIAFYIDPVAYLNNIGNIGQIILVPASTDGPEDLVRASEPTPPNPGDELPPDGEPWPLSVEQAQEGGNDAGWQDWPSETIGNMLNVVRLKRGTTLKLTSYWEFVPYNDASFLTPAGTAVAFMTTANAARELLLSPHTPKDDRDTCLSNLKQAYITAFGKGPKKQNGISLFLYAGPTSMSNVVTLDAAGSNLLKHCHPLCCSPTAQIIEQIHGSALYTGDGFLETPARLNSLKTYLGIPAQRSIMALQVMHHGSQKNWYQGIAQAIAPDFSLFSSEPNTGHRHPDKAVWKDFANYGRQQVNSSSGFLINLIW